MNESRGDRGHDDDDLEPWQEGYQERAAANPRDLETDEGRAWLREQIRGFTFSEFRGETIASAETADTARVLAEGMPRPYDATTVERILDWFMSRPLQRYATWDEEREYWWCAHRIEIHADFPAARSAVLCAIDAERCPTLDDWLLADKAGKLLHRGEAGGISKVVRAVRERERGG